MCEWIMELSFPRTFAPGSERSIGGTFVPWNFRSREWKWRVTFAHWHELSVINTELKKAFDKVFLLTMSAVSGNNNFWTRGRVKVACHFPYWERKFYVIFALGSESSRERKFHPWNFSSQERKYVGTKVPVTCVSDLWMNMCASGRNISMF